MTIKLTNKANKVSCPRKPWGTIWSDNPANPAMTEIRVGTGVAAPLNVVPFQKAVWRQQPRLTFRLKQQSSPTFFSRPDNRKSLMAPKLNRVIRFASSCHCVSRYSVRGTLPWHFLKWEPLSFSAKDGKYLNYLDLGLNWLTSQSQPVIFS